MTPLSAMDISSGQKQQGNVGLHTVDQMNLIDIYKTFRSTVVEYTFFASACGTFFKIHYVIDHKASLSKFKNTKIIQIIFAYDNGMRLEINNIKKTQKFASIWKQPDS